MSEQNKSDLNADALVGADQDGFNPSKPRSEPMTTSGHKPGVLASEADRAPEFHAQTLPAGSAPPDRTFKPNPVDDVPISQSKPAKASDTIQGSTSGDVHKGLGDPSAASQKSGGGLEGVGAKVDNSKVQAFEGKQHGAGRDAAGRTSTRGAEDLQGETAETVAAENPAHGSK